MEHDTDRKRGMELVRRLDQDERALLRAASEATRDRTPGGLRPPPGGRLKQRRK